MAKCLNLSDGQVMAYHKAMADCEDRYQAMRRASYTLVTEGSPDDRLLHQGTRQTTFSHVRGDPYRPAAGLGLNQCDGDTYKALR